MGWWIGTVAVWFISAVWIFFVMADVFRGKKGGLSGSSLFGYSFHGGTAVLALWMLTKALSA